MTREEKKASFLKNFTGKVKETCYDEEVGFGEYTGWRTSDKSFADAVDALKPKLRTDINIERLIKVASDPNVRTSARVAEIMGIHEPNICYWKRRDPEFKKRYNKALKG